jgi:hypothetical protein
MIFSTDGEAIVLHEAFDTEILAGFRSAMTDYLKNGPSSTSIHQACDVSPAFRDFKKGLKTVASRGMSTKNLTLEMHLKQAFTEFSFAFPLIDLSNKLKDKIVCACEKIVYVMQAAYVTPKKIITGFEECGQHIRDTAPGESTVDYDKIISKCILIDKLTDTELNTMRNEKHAVQQQFINNGSVTNSFLDEHKIPKAEANTNRDNFTISRGDTQVITHEDTVQKFKARQLAKETQNEDTFTNAIGITEAQTLVEAHEKKERKKVAEKEKREIEKTRRANLTATQRKNEDGIKKSNKEKAAKDKADKLLQATQVLRNQNN